MKLFFTPERVVFEKKALNYPLGRELYTKFKNAGISTEVMTSVRITDLPGKTPAEKYRQAKRILAVTIKKNLTFSTCRPSAHYQLPLSTSCPGRCEYCYLQTTLGRQPYLRVYVNLEEILQKAKKYIDKRVPDITLFEASATSDPVSLEPWTGTLYKTIEFFGSQEYGRLRFVTKFTQVDALLQARHHKNTRIRYSINTDYIIRTYEKGTPPLNLRLEAAGKTAGSSYPLGFILAPIFIYANWKEDYHNLLKLLKKKLPPECEKELTFELITHRFTKRAKNIILERFPESSLDMEESRRMFKWGQFGYGKYLYLPEERKELKSFFFNLIEELFPLAKIEYFV